MKTEANHPINQISDQGFPSNLDVVMKDEYPLAIGLTKREAFAMAAMQGYLASYPSDSSPNAVNVAKYSVEYADALIEALNKETA